MPVQSIDVREGDPTTQASGQVRGTVDVTFTDGRVFTRNLRAADLDAWNDMIANYTAVIEAQVAESDAYDDLNPDEDIAAHKEATVKQRAVAYLREAMQQEYAREGYRRLWKFDQYRQAQGWTVNQVVTNLLEAGLTQEEWDEMLAAYQYLSDAGRPAIMNDYHAIQEQWSNR